MVFRPTLWPTLFTVPALATLRALGTWQLHRLEWKQDLIDKLQSRSTGSAVAAPDAGADLAAFEFQRVRATGVFRHDRELYLIGRSVSGAPGLHVLAPLVPADGSPAILVPRTAVPSSVPTGTEAHIAANASGSSSAASVSPMPSSR